MKERERNRQEKLTRLFQSAGPASTPTLEPDAGLPARIRAMVREGATESSGARAGQTPLLRPRWAWLSFGTAGLAVAVAVGGYIGYRAGNALAASSTVDIEQAAAGQADTADFFLGAWSQSGFEEDLRQWNAGNGEVKE
jgi:hypothetical protein